MGTGLSRIYTHTFGSKKSIPSVKQIKANNQKNVVSWAEAKALKLTSTQRSKFNTASVVYDESTGEYYYGRNAGIEKDGHPKNPILFGDKDHKGILPKESLNAYKVGNCAEVDAINNALNNGAKLENLHLTTIHATQKNMGKSKQACENCTYAFKDKIKTNFTGWNEEEKK